MVSVLVVSHDQVGSRMAGTGIRYYEVARALVKQGIQVTLAAPEGSALPSSCDVAGDLRFFTYGSTTDSDFLRLIKEHQFFVAHQYAVWLFRHSLASNRIFVVVDGYDISLFEILARNAVMPSEEQSWFFEHQNHLDFVLKRGDFFVVATERQRDFWLGLLAAVGRITLDVYKRDPSLRSLVDLLPYGMPDEPPKHTRRVMRGVVPGIGDEDFVVLWGGGVWQWLDPLTLVKAASIVAQHRSDVKFFFPGLSHPAQEIVKPMPIQEELIKLSEQYNLKDKVMFFGGWVNYEDLQNYLLESNCGISLHPDHIESRFAARARIMSYIWADLPMILTAGDEWSEMLARLGVAKLVQPGSAESVAEAILEMARRENNRFLSNEVKKNFFWSTCVRNLVEKIEQFSVNFTVRSLDNYQAKVEEETREIYQKVCNLRLPSPNSFFAKLLHPLLRDSVLWYLESIVAQQNQLNALVVERLARHEIELAEIKSRLCR